MFTCHVCFEDVSPDAATEMDCGHCYCNDFGYVVVPLDESIHGRRLVGTVVGASKKTRQSGLNVQEGIFTDTCIITIGTRRTQTRLSRKAISRKLSSKRSPFQKNKQSRIKDYTWVMNRSSRLFRSRRVLSYLYPFAFYMFGDELFKDEMTAQERELKQNLFEDQQQQLESNVEKLSMFLEKDFQDFSDDEVMDTMKYVINLSNVVDKLCKLMYQCIENDLLYPLQRAHSIAPYKSKGLERASELSICWDSDESLRSMKPNNEESCPPWNSIASQSGPSSSDESGCSFHKRPRRDARGGGGPLFDLNMPAEVVDMI